MRNTAILVIIATVIAKVIGLGRDLSLSYFYGTSYISDAYLISITICTFIFGMIGQSFKASYIPLYREKEIKYSKDVANSFTANLINIVLIIIIVITVIAFTFTEQIVRIFASGFEGEVLDLTVVFTRIAMIGMSLSILVHLFSGFLQIKGNHKLPALITLPLNLVVITMIILSSNVSVMYLPFGLLLGTLLQFLILFSVSYKYGYRSFFKINLRDSAVLVFFKNAIPIFIGTSAHQINLVVDRTLASQIIEGGISALNYANRLNGFVQAIFVLSITAVMYPILSKEALEGNSNKFNQTISYSLNAITILILPASIFTIVFSEEIVKLLFGRGSFTEESIHLTAGPLYFYSIGMIAFAFKEVLNKAFYAQKNTRTPMKNSLIGVFINIILNFVLSYYMGINGLAFATSIAAFVTTSLLFYSYKKYYPGFKMKHIFNIFVKTMLSSLIMGLVLWSIYPMAIEVLNQWLAMILIVIIGGIIYVLLLLVMKVEEIKSLVVFFFNKIKIN